MRSKSNFMQPRFFLIIVLFTLFVCLIEVKARIGNAEQCTQPLPLSQSEKDEVIKNIRQIIGGYDPNKKAFLDAKSNWLAYHNCLQTPAIQKAAPEEINAIRARISQSALTSLITWLKLENETSEAKSITAQIMMLHGYSDAARELTQQAISLDANNFEPHYLMGIINSDSASAEWAIKLNPNFAPAYNLKAELLLTETSKLEGEEQQANYRAALETIRKMLTLPAPPAAEFWREQQNSLTLMLKTNSVATSQSAKTASEHTQPSTAQNDSTPFGIKADQRTGTDSGIGSGSGSGVGTGQGNGIGNGAGTVAPRESDSLTKPAPTQNNRLTILAKPRAQYTELARLTLTSGTVRVRVTFSADGQIRNVLVMNFLPFGLTPQAVQAAKQIRFTPEIRNGAPVSVSKMIEYNFNIY